MAIRAPRQADIQPLPPDGGGPTRRDFITRGLGAAGLGTAAAMLPGCGIAHPGGLPTASTRAGTVAVVGAGIAGLATAAELRAMGFEDVMVLEARDRIGGRIWTASIGDGVPVDLGASWIHGIADNPIAAIASENDIDLKNTDYGNETVHVHGDAALPKRGRVLNGFWKLARRRPRTALRAIYEKYVTEVALGEADRRYLAYVLNTSIEHEFAADLGDLSFRSITGGKAWAGRDAVFPGGYEQIVDVLAADLDIRVGQAVTSIDHAGPGVVLTTASGDTIEARTVVVTVPLGVLKAGTIEFRPALPERKQRAIGRLGMGVLNKACLLFDDVFWPKDVELIGYVGPETGRWAETLNLYPYTQQPIVMMFNAAAYGRKMEELSDAEITAEALAALADMYGPVPRPTDVRITRWGSDPWAYGSYSYVPAGSSFRQHAEFARPVGSRIFFAGEATHQDYPATVHGAFLSGARAGREVAASMGFGRQLARTGASRQERQKGAS